MKEYVLRYNAPADHTNSGWQNSVLPIGNGYMGMCIFGDASNEILQINEKTFRDGGPSKSRPDYNGGNINGSYLYLKQMQDALERDDKDKVASLKNKLVGIMDGYGNYLTFGEINIDFNQSNITNYQRGLDLNSAISTVEFDRAGGHMHREYFASYPDRAIAGKFTSKDKNINCAISFDIPRDGYAVSVEDSAIVISGNLEDNELAYYARLAVVCDGVIEKGKDCLNVKNAANCEFYFSVATDYAQSYPTYRGENPKSLIDSIIAGCLEQGYEKIKTKHIADYKQLFDRTPIDLGASVSKQTTDKLVAAYKKGHNGNDARYYEELLFEYGRYLLIASSRKGSLPANLQGVWNNSNTPAWSCDYHLNVNLQMCYWHAYVANLAETATPMIEYMESLREPGRITAKEYHNIISDKEHPQNGWVCHTQCTTYGWTCPGWEFNWGWSPAASSWMMQNCFDYYAYTEDKKMLKDKIYPMMKENALFWVQNLIFNKEQDRWVSSPSYSPEHGPISVGNTYEQEMVWILFNDTVRAGEILGVDKEFLNKLKEIMPKLAPLEVGKWGQVKEWYEEDDWGGGGIGKRLRYAKHSCQYKHRHASHLIGLYPAIHITRETPQLFAAAAVSLKDRGLGGVLGNNSGWGKANKINMWARLKNGEEAFNLVVSLLRGNIANNLWDLHPPFQMDGNCGYTSGVCEMLVYSDFKYVELLPALPHVWKNGAIKGVCARGGYVVDMKWSDGKVTEYKIASKDKKTVVLRFNGKEEEVATNKTVVL